MHLTLFKNSLFNLIYSIKQYSCIFSLVWCLLEETNIGAVKNCLHKTVGRATLNSSQFLTVLSDIQLAINNRPLSFVDLISDIDAITPNKLVSPSSHFSNLIITDVQDPLANDIDAEETKIAFVNTLEKPDIFVDRFRLDWYNAYLTSLRPTFKKIFSIPIQNPWISLSRISCFNKTPH